MDIANRLDNVHALGLVDAIMSDIDQNEIIAKIAVDSMERSMNVFTKSLDEARRKVSVKFGSGFKKFKSASVSRYGSVRTLMHRDKPIPLRDLYVETRLEHQKKVVTDESIFKALSDPARILIVGTAGGGKSMLMRFTNLVLAESENGVLPVFFELRTLNSTPGKSLIDALVDHAKVHITDLDIEIFENLIEDRRIVLILDGFDEIDHDQRERFALEISELSRKFPQITLIVSSRPDDLISSVEIFSVYRVLPFEKDQAIDLLGRLPYDIVVRDKFIKAVHDELFDRHKDFLSNPLLVSMMLMTYHQFAEIPNKVHIFYQQAFETLFSWHDSSKDVFKRKSYTDLPIDEFQRVFSYFCTSSYLLQAFTFSSTRIRQLISSAIKAERIDTSSDLLLKDLLESTCLLQREGLEIVFVHRSFQEYFTALFITRLEPSARKKALDAVTKRAHSDLVIPMAYEMAPAAIEKVWVIPTAKSLLRKITTSAANDPIKKLAIPFEFISFSREKVALHWKISDPWGSKALALDRVVDFKLPAMAPGAIEHAYVKMLDRMKNREYYNKVLDESYYPNRPEVEDLPDQLLIPLGRGISEIFDDLGMSSWSEAVVRWLENIVAEMEVSVSSREISIDAMLTR